jgi:cell division transport system permease protein
MITNSIRIAKNSWRNFYRNLWLSLATLGMMVLALTVIGGLVLFNASLGEFVGGLQDKVDVSVYFAEDTDEREILAVAEELKARPDIKEVRYISRNEALDIFYERHVDSPILLESLNELDGNPLQASINIKVHNPEDFAPVVTTLEGSDAAALIDSINFRENEKVIERINEISANVSRTGVLFTILLGIFVFVVTYNTIRLAIYTARDEIHIMKLVGASNWFVRGPFILTGALYGVVATMVTLAILFVTTWLLGTQVSVVFAEINLFGYLAANVLLVGGVLLSSGMSLGAVSSYFATRRYLDV